MKRDFERPKPLENITLEILNNKILLDSECWNCSGGRIKKEDHRDPVFYDDRGECEQCKDTGYNLTDAGHAIMKLVNRHWRHKV